MTSFDKHTLEHAHGLNLGFALTQPGFNASNRVVKAATSTHRKEKYSNRAEVVAFASSVSVRRMDASSPKAVEKISGPVGGLRMPELRKQVDVFPWLSNWKQGN